MKWTRVERTEAHVLFMSCREKGLWRISHSGKVQCSVKDVACGFSREKGNDGACCYETLLWRCRGRMSMWHQSAAVECAWVCSGLQTAAQPLTHCCLNASLLTRSWFPCTLPSNVSVSPWERKVCVSSSTNDCCVLHAWKRWCALSDESGELPERCPSQLTDRVCYCWVCRCAAPLWWIH